MHYWLIEKRVMLVVGAQTDDEAMMKAEIIATGEMLQEGISPAHLIIDMSNVGRFRFGVSSPIQEMRGVMGDARNRWTIIITNNPLVRFFGTVAAKILGGYFTTAPNVDEALAILRAHDSSLDSLPTQKRSTQEVQSV